MEGNQVEDVQAQTAERKSKILNGFLQYYHLAEWAVTVTFIRKGEDLVFEFLKGVKKEGAERSVLQTVTRRLAMKKPQANWTELLLSSELRCSASFAAEADLDTNGFSAYNPLVVNLTVIVDPAAPIAQFLPPLEMWKKQEVTVSHEVFSFPAALLDGCTTCKAVSTPPVEGKKEFFERLHTEAAKTWELAGPGMLPGSAGSKPFVLYTYEEVCQWAKTQKTLGPYESVIKERTDLTGAKLMLWADGNLPLSPPNKFESFVNQLRVVLQPKGYLQISPFEYIKTIGDEYNSNLEALNQELLNKFGLSLHYILQFWEGRKEKKDATPKKGEKTKTPGKSAKHLDYSLVYQLPVTLNKIEKEKRFILDSCPQYSLYFNTSDKEWKDKWTVKGVEHDCSKVDLWWKDNSDYRVTVCHNQGKFEVLGSTRRQFGESPVDTAIRKLNSDLYGYFSESILAEKFASFCVPEKTDYFGGYLITFNADPVDLPANFVENINKFQKERAAVSDGEILFSATPKFWAGTHDFSTPKITEIDACISVSPPSTQLHWLLVRERVPVFLKTVPTLYTNPLKLPVQKQPPQPPQEPQPTMVAKITNRPYILNEDAMKTFFGGLEIVGIKSFGRTILVKFASFDDLAKALNADGMFFGLSGHLRVEPSTEEDFNGERKPLTASPEKGASARGGATGGRGGRGGQSGQGKGPSYGSGRSGRGGRGRGGF